MTDLENTAAEPQATGVVETLARDDVERKQFLKHAGKMMGSGAAATALAAFIAACGGSKSTTSSATSSGSAGSASASASSSSTTATTAGGMGSGDLKIVNYALTLEYLEAQFYDKVGASGLFHGATLSTLKMFGQEEHEHVATLMGAASKLGTPAAEPMGKFPIQSAAQVTKLAATVENLGAAAYLGQAGAIQSKEILAVALSIHTIEARHASVLNTLLKMPPTPTGAFAQPATMAEVLMAVKPFIA